MREKWLSEYHIFDGFQSDLEVYDFWVVPDKLLSKFESWLLHFIL